MLHARTLALAAGAALIASLVVACGGGDGTGSDEDYISAFCDARREFTENLDTAVKQVSTGGDKEFGQIADVFTELADDFDDMKPPEDLKDWHDTASKQLSDAAEKIEKEKNLQAVTSLPPLADMPAGPRERLRNQAQNYDSCKGLNAFGA